MSSRTRNVIAVAVSALLTAQLSIVGAMQIMGAEPIASNVRALGFPGWFRVVVGIVQLVAVVGLWRRATRFAAACALSVVLLGAVAAHLRIGEGADRTLPAVVTLALVALLATLRRPERVD